MDELDRLRDRIDALDAEISERIAQRFEVCRIIAGIKRDQSIPMMNTGRVDKVHAHYQRVGAAQGTPAAFTTAFVDLLIAATCQMEDEIIGTPSHPVSAER